MPMLIPAVLGWAAYGLIGPGLGAIGITGLGATIIAGVAAMGIASAASALFAPGKKAGAAAVVADPSQTIRQGITSHKNAVGQARAGGPISL